MRRVLVIGPGGAGKSWLATRIGEITGLPVIHLDRHYWNAGWRPTPDVEWRKHVSELVSRERWVMDGNYGGTLDLRFAARDTVVFLDMPRRITIPRVIRRWLQFRHAARPDVAEGCPDRLTLEFLLWIWNYPRRRRPLIMKKLRALPSHSVHVLRSRTDVESFLSRLRTQQSHDRGLSVGM